MNRERSLTEHITLVERKLELRRQRMQRHWQEARVTVERGAGWLPLLGVAGALVAGIAVGRRGRPPAAAAPTRTGVLATIAALGAAAVRFALSPAGRALWATFRSARTR